MNVFGGGASGSSMEKGPRGPRGYRGKDGSLTELCTWLPESVIDNLRKNEESGAFFIQNLEKDIIRSKGENGAAAAGTPITQWISRSKKGGNLVAKKAASELEEIETMGTSGYAMSFKTNHYENRQSSFLTPQDKITGFICITFRTQSDRQDQVLISGPDPGNERAVIRLIKVSQTDIMIQIGEVTEHIQISCKDWTTLFIEYNDDGDLTHFTYEVEGIIGSFTAPSPITLTQGFNLGCKWHETEYFEGQIASVEFYDNYEAKGTPLPDVLKNLVIEYLIQFAQVESYSN